jgi:hypothetical protein
MYQKDSANDSERLRISTQLKADLLLPDNTGNNRIPVNPWPDDGSSLQPTAFLL